MAETKKEETEEENNLLLFKKFNDEAFIPQKAFSDSTGYDLRALRRAVVSPGEPCVINIGIGVRSPEGTYCRIVGRSGLAAAGIDVGAGLCGRNYVGEVFIVLYNHGKTDYVISKGDRIAQLVCEEFRKTRVVQVSELGSSERGERGLGSTGK